MSIFQSPWRHMHLRNPCRPLSFERCSPSNSPPARDRRKDCQDDHNGNSRRQSNDSTVREVVSIPPSRRFRVLHVGRRRR